MTPTLSTIAGLRRAVCADPHDDTARLVLADALEEHGSSEQERQWAELIRCQIRMSSLRAQCWCGACVKPGQQHHNSSCAVDKERDELPGGRSKPAMLRQAESALLRELTPWLRRGERCERCKGKGRFTNSTKLGGTHTSGCPTCHGTGWLGSLAERVQRFRHSGADGILDPQTSDRVYKWAIPATFSRGLVSRVELTAAQVQDAAFMARLFSEWPVTEAGLVGAVPMNQSSVRIGMATSWDWYNSDLLHDDGGESLIPAVLFDEMLAAAGQDKHTPTNFCEFLSAEAAKAALSDAIVSLGRTAAGLPQIGGAP